MGLERVVFDELLKAKETFRRDVSLSCLGYPDLLVEKDHLEKCGVKDFVSAKDSQAIAAWHGWPHEIYGTSETLMQLGIIPGFYDISNSRGEEKLIDLNEPSIMSYCDLMYDGGTLEHVFNIGQGFKNLLSAVGIGGMIIHLNPLSQGNHGHWNINPTAYFDFYTQNGFEIRKIKMLQGPLTNRTVTDLHPTKRFQLLPECSIMTVVRKVSTVPFRWPMQTKYLSNKNLKA